MFGSIILGLVALFWQSLPLLAGFLAILLSLGTTGDSVTNKNLPDAVVFNEMWDSVAWPIWARACPSVIVAMGTPIKDGTGKILTDPATGLPTLSRTSRVKGRKIEAQTETDIDDGEGIDTEWSDDRSSLVEPDDYFNQEWDWARIRWELNASGRTLSQYSNAGAQAKTDWIDTMSKRMANQQARTLAKMLNKHDGTNGLPTKKVWGSLWAAIDDGFVNAGYSAYGLITRATSGNEDYRPAYINGSVGVLERWILGKCALESQIRGGKLKVAMSGTDVSLVIEDILQGFAEADIHDDMIEFGWSGLMYKGIRFVVDGFAPAGGLLPVDPDTFHTWMDDGPAVPGADMNGSGNAFQRDIRKKDGYFMEHFKNGQTLCRAVNRNCKLLGISTR